MLTINFFQRAAIFVAMLLFTSSAEAQPIELKTYSTHSRIRFRVDPGVATEWKSSKKGFELVLKGVSLVDLGAPFGNELEWVQRYQNIGDSRLRSISMEETVDGLRVRGVWRFPTGDDAPAYPSMEHFEYRDRQPPRYVIDFWLKEGPSVAQVRKKKEIARKAAALKRAQKRAEAREERRLALIKKKSEAADMSKLCSEPLDEQSHVFLQFYPVHRKVDFSQWFPHSRPDRDFQYLSPKGENQEVQYVRLALKLYETGKFALVGRTIDFLNEEFPKSSHLAEMKFLRANALSRLGYFEESHALLRDIIQFERDSSVAIHAGKFLAGKAYHDKNYLLALESFMGMIRRHPGHRLNWVFHLGAAESLYALRQTDRALPEYKWILKHATNEDAQAMAGLRMGDLYMERRLYAQAIATYYKALTHFSKQAQSFPEIHLNRGEAFYWLGEFDRAEKEFMVFLEKDQGSSAGWRATYRLGEIYGRRPGKINQQESRKWFFKTINLFPVSNASTLARLQLLPCGDHGKMDLETAQRFIKDDAKVFKAGGEVFQEDYKDFMYLNYVRYLIFIDREDLAANVLAEVMDSGLSKKARTILGDSFKVVFATEINRLIQQDKKYAALAFYDKYYRKVPQGGKEISSDIYLALSRVASDLEIVSLSKKMISKYRDLIKKEAKRRIAEKKDDFAVLDMDLKASEEDFTEAKALWIEYRNQKKGSLPKIKKLLNGVIDESPYSYQKEMILSMIKKMNKKTKKALQHAIKAQLLMSTYTKILDLEVDYWIGILQEKNGEADAAIKTYQRLEANLQRIEEKKIGRKIASFDTAVAIGVPRLPGFDEIVERRASLLEKEKRWGELASTYSRMIDDGRTENRIKYAYFRALGKVGGQKSMDKANQMLKEIVESKEEGFWKNLAQEALENRESLKN